MGESFGDLLDRLIEVRDADYRNDLEAQEARFRNLESIMQTMLEKLRDRFDR